MGVEWGGKNERRKKARSSDETWEDCPSHGRQKVVGSGVCGAKEDPYGTDKLACGHEVAAFGPGEPMVIVR